MMQQLSPETWKILRAAKRRQPQPANGRELRLIPSRKIKDGTFLDALVKAGLLEVRSGPTAKSPDEDEPAQFRTKYGLTTLGEHAAEYGEYEIEIPGATADTPVTGLMAELLKARESTKKPVAKK
jgi:hypothetical protein